MILTVILIIAVVALVGYSVYSSGIIGKAITQAQNCPPMDFDTWKNKQNFPGNTALTYAQDKYNEYLQKIQPICDPDKPCTPMSYDEWLPKQYYPGNIALSYAKDQYQKYLDAVCPKVES